MLTSVRSEGTDAPPTPGGASTRLDFLLLAAVLACVALMAYGTLTRRAGMSPDTAVYVDAALHVVAGEGLQRSILMFFQPDHVAGDAMRVPLTLYAPLYPLAVSVPIALGMPAPCAALAVSLLFLALLVCTACALARHLYGAPAAALGLGILLHFGPLLFVAGYAWSETMAIAFLLAGFFMLSRPPRGRSGVTWCLLSGFCFGLAFSTRYALLPAVFLAAAWTLTQRPHRWRRTGALLLGFAPPGGAVILRNFLAQGRPFGPPRGPSTQGLLQNMADTWAATAQAWLPPAYLAPGNQVRLLVCILAVLAGIAIIRQRGNLLRDALVRGPRMLPLLWAAGYLLFLVVYRSRYEMDPIGPRLVLPGLAPLVPAAAACVAAVLSPKGRGLRAAAVALVVFACVREVLFIHGTPAAPPTAYAAASERMHWVCTQTTPDDLIIGDRIYDIPLFCGQRQGLCFFPDTAPAHHVTPERLHAFLKPRRGKFERCFIVLNRVTYDEPAFEPEWRRLCGDFVAGLVYGKAGEWPEITETARLRDGYVFEVDVARFLARSGADSTGGASGG